MDHGMSAPEFPQWADVQCPLGDTFRIEIKHAQVIQRPGTTRIEEELHIDDLLPAFRQHLTKCEWNSADAQAESMYELHPPGARIGFNGEVFVVGEDGYWRNRFGQIPAGQMTVPPEPPRHCRGCRCDEPRLPPGRRQHGGGV